MRGDAPLAERLHVGVARAVLRAGRGEEHRVGREREARAARPPPLPERDVDLHPEREKRRVGKQLLRRRLCEQVAEEAGERAAA